MLLNGIQVATLTQTFICYTLLGESRQKSTAINMAQLKPGTVYRVRAGRHYSYATFSLPNFRRLFGSVSTESYFRTVSFCCKIAMFYLVE